MRKQTLREKQTEETRQELIKAGTKLFGKLGFRGSSAEQIVKRAGVSRGALYHHFPRGKLDLFIVVAEKLQSELIENMEKTANSKTSKGDITENIVAAYFDVATNKQFQRIMLQDAPSVLGWEEWRAFDRQYALKFLQLHLKVLFNSKPRRTFSIDMFAAALFGACCETTLTIAMASDKTKAKAEAIHVITMLVKSNLNS